MIEAYVFECEANTYKAANGHTYFKGQKFHLSPKAKNFAFFNSDSCFKKTRQDVADENAKLVGLEAPPEPAPPKKPEGEPENKSEGNSGEPGDGSPNDPDQNDPETDEPDATDISELDLDEAEFEVLLENGIGSVEQLEDFDSIEKLKTLKNVGDARANKIMKALKAYLKK